MNFPLLVHAKNKSLLLGPHNITVGVLPNDPRNWGVYADPRKRGLLGHPLYTFNVSQPTTNPMVSRNSMITIIMNYLLLRKYQQKCMIFYSSFTMFHSIFYSIFVLTTVVSMVSWSLRLDGPSRPCGVERGMKHRHDRRSGPVGCFAFRVEVLRHVGTLQPVLSSPHPSCAPSTPEETSFQGDLTLLSFLIMVVSIGI